MRLHRHRDFRLLWLGQAGSSFGASVTSVALPLTAVAVLGAGTFQVALLTAAAWLPWLLVGLPAGAWVDRLPRRPVMVTCDLVAAALFLSVPVAGWLGLLTVGHLLAVALAGGTVSVFFKTAYQVYLPPCWPGRTCRRGTRNYPYLRVLTVFGAVSNLGLIGYQSILVVFLVREVGIGPGAVGGLIALMSLGGVLGATAATPLSRRLGSARALLFCEIGAAPFGLLVPLTAPGARLALPVVAGVAIGAGVVVGNVLKGGFRQAYVPHPLLGRVVVTMQVVNYGTIPLGAVLGGALGTALGLRPAMWVITSGLALTGLILLVGPLRGRRDLPESYDAAAPPPPARSGLVSAAGR
ncbi:MFS transporter [Plantactinospora sp. WMMB334]|uniref:MFS transporter n=1 Tax=Plantactinospora sp. WMMB334 TaxID=3404119 RepID=UPI003B932EE9